MRDVSAIDAVGVVGLGYVGLPLALAFAAAGFDVVGVDVDEQRVAQLRAGDSPVEDVSDRQVATALDTGFTPTTSYASLAAVDGVSICVPTPLRKSGQPDVSYVVAATEQLAPVIDDETTVVLESTVYPGATEEVVASRLEAEGLTVGQNVFVAFSPERIDPGNSDYGTTDIPKVVGGVTDRCRDRVLGLYGAVFEEIVPVDSAIEAEFVKLLENTFRSVNIGLINELALAADRFDVDIWTVIDAAATKPFGFMPFYPGPGLGGHCLPVDPQYLSWKAKQQGVETRFIDLADRINHSMPEHVVTRVSTLLNKSGIPVLDANILLVGVAYKAGVSDTRESPAVDIIDQFRARNASVSYHDPHVERLATDDWEYDSRPLSRQLLEAQDCVVIVTDHDAVDIELLVDHAPRIFDTRNATAASADAAHIHRL
jgi:UDP-N-acetyl-D-glucosamine dehydrogenase